MYGALWRILPGPWWIRAVLVLILVLAVAYALFTWVYPWVDSIINPLSVTVPE